MPDSDEDYNPGISDDDADAHTVSRGGRTHTTVARDSPTGDDRGVFQVDKTWDAIVEDEDGTIHGAVEELLEGAKRRRLLKDTTPLQRGIIRHLIVVLDFSQAMAEKDFRPTRHLLTLRYAQEFVTDYFEQNPISQLGIIGMRDGLAVRVSDMSGNPNDHITALQSFRDQEPKGNPSLQNALEMARGALFHAPSHGTREALVVFGSLLSADPGDIHMTITALVKARITCTVIGLSAEVAVCRTLVSRTNPSLNPATTYSVALHEQHYRELFMAATTPPPTAAAAISAAEETAHNSLLMMGFPSRTISTYPSLCACHSKPTRGGYLCSRCKSKVCALPSTCPACGLTLILSTHLARSYHHLFPLQNWKGISWERAEQKRKEEGGPNGESSHCFACLIPFAPRPEPKKEPKKVGGREQNSSGLDPKRSKRMNRDRADGAKDADPKRPKTSGRGNAATRKDGTSTSRQDSVSESGRYECPTCKRWFCIDCDLFAHEVVHNCPGCQSREAMLAKMYGAHQSSKEDVEMGNGDLNGQSGD